MLPLCAAALSIAQSKHTHAVMQSCRLRLQPVLVEGHFFVDEPTVSSPQDEVKKSKGLKWTVVKAQSPTRGFLEKHMTSKKHFPSH